MGTPKSIAAIRQECNLPDDAKSLGYVVHLPDKGEFLAVSQMSQSMVQRAFADTPDGAKIYKSYKKALRDAKSCKQGAIACLLFDIDNRYVIAEVE